MKIVQVAGGSVRMPPSEGSAPLQVVFNTSKHLATMGHEVTIVDRKYSKNDPPAEWVEGVEIARLRVLQVPPNKAPRSMRFIIAELNAFLFAIVASGYLRENGSKIDVVHLHLTSTGLILSIMNKGLRGKMFYTCHLGEWQLASQRLSMAERIHLLLDPYLMRRVRKVITSNETAKESFISLGKVKADNIALVHNGVDTDFFNPYIAPDEGVRRRHGIDGKLTVLFVGRLARIKGIEHLMEAANIVVNEFNCKNVLFLLVGPSAFVATEQPISTDEILHFVRQHHMENQLKLAELVPTEELRLLYAVSDIFVLPSLAEGDPLVTMEAMASGKPLIGTRVGGIKQQIRDGWNGFLIDPADARQLAEKIKYLIDNPDERKNMGANSRMYAEAEYDWKKVAARLVKVYQDQE